MHCVALTCGILHKSKLCGPSVAFNEEEKKSYNEMEWSGVIERYMLLDLTVLLLSVSTTTFDFIGMRERHSMVNKLHKTSNIMWTILFIFSLLVTVLGVLYSLIRNSTIYPESLASFKRAIGFALKDCSVYTALTSIMIYDVEKLMFSRLTLKKRIWMCQANSALLITFVLWVTGLMFMVSHIFITLISQPKLNFASYRIALYWKAVLGNFVLAFHAYTLGVYAQHREKIRGKDWFEGETYVV